MDYGTILNFVQMQCKFFFLGYVSIGDAMALTKYLNKEDELSVWSVVLTNLRSAFTLFNGHSNTTFVVMLM